MRKKDRLPLRASEPGDVGTDSAEALARRRLICAEGRAVSICFRYLENTSASWRTSMCLLKMLKEDVDHLVMREDS